MNDELTFYTHPRSRGRMIWWMLEEVGADYDTKVLEYGDEMKSEEYLAINPMGKVPAIVHGDQVVTECAAICAYLADVFSEAGLSPRPKERADYYRWLFFAAGPLEAAMVDRRLGVEVPEEMEVTVGYGTYERVVDTLEDKFAGGGYVAGTRFTAADVYVGSHIGHGLQLELLDRRPAFEAYWSRVCQRPAYRRAEELADRREVTR